MVYLKNGLGLSFSMVRDKHLANGGAATGAFREIAVRRTALDGFDRPFGACAVLNPSLFLVVCVEGRQVCNLTEEACEQWWADDGGVCW